MKRISRVAVRGFSEVEHKTKEERVVRLEGKGFFVVHADLRSNRIVLEHYSYDRRIKNKFVGLTAKSLCDSVVKRGLVEDVSHAAYLGRELMKAEVALRLKLRYVQDKGLDFS
jgi:tetrahydromethanopterin S-methyltransferase subunit A